MAPLPLAGGCLCGAVADAIDAAPTSVMVCHCATCRRAAGAPSVAWATVPAAGFALTAGAPAEYASSPGVIRTHCAACRTSLTFRRDGGDIDVTLASLDDPEALPPDYEGWLSHRLSWEASTQPAPAAMTARARVLRRHRSAKSGRPTARDLTTEMRQELTSKGNLPDLDRTYVPVKDAWAE